MRFGVYETLSMAAVAGLYLPTDSEMLIAAGGVQVVPSHSWT